MRGRPESDDGTIMVLTLVLLVVVSLVVSALLATSSSNLTNIANFQTGRSLQEWSDGAAQIALQDVRYNPQVCTSTLSAFADLSGPLSFPATTSTIVSANNFGNVSVGCSSVTSGNFRTVTLDICPNEIAGACSTLGAMTNTGSPYLKVTATVNDSQGTGSFLTVNGWVFSNATPNIG